MKNHGAPQIFTTDEGGIELNLNRIVAEAERHGMNMHYHAQGDLAIQAILDALAQMVATRGKLRAVHTIIHLAFPTDAQIERIAGFNGSVVTTMQPGFWPVESDTQQYYGARAGQAYPLKKLIGRGVSVGISTDFSVSPPEYTPPTVVMSIAATGRPDPAVHLPVSVRDVVQGFTLVAPGPRAGGDMRVYRGYKADMVVYDTDLYLIAPADLTAGRAKVLSTWIGGCRTA